MWCSLVEIRRPRCPVYVEARIYCGKERRYTHSAMSEAGARSWLASQGIPFHKQPRYVAVHRED